MSQKMPCPCVCVCLWVGERSLRWLQWEFKNLSLEIEHTAYWLSKQQQGLITSLSAFFPILSPWLFLLSAIHFWVRWEIWSFIPSLGAWRVDRFGSDTVGCVQAATFILDMGVIVMIGENVSVAFRASVANADTMALATKSHGTLTAPSRTFRWILF